MNKVSDEEFSEIKKLKENILSIISTIGELHLSKVMLKAELNTVENRILDEENKFTKFQENERVLVEKLQQKYGAGSINLDTGEISEE